jgi:hypothetical protein
MSWITCHMQVKVVLKQKSFVMGAKLDWILRTKQEHTTTCIAHCVTIRGIWNL